MTTSPQHVDLSLDDIRAVTGYAAGCATTAMPFFTTEHPDEPRPREAIDTALSFAEGGKRTNALRRAAFAALAAAKEAATPAAAEAARAAGHAAAAAFLHPLAQATQVKHILGSAAYAARAAELDAGDDRRVGDEWVDRAHASAPELVVAVLRRYPEAPEGGGRIGELLRVLDAALRR
ncbi:putative immunity protein [Cellulosimicrobium sp. Marseille-Q8652]